MNRTIHTKLQGFTIVDLLIVIVVIAILATISIAAYTNIQQRAKNTAIINAASQSLKMIEAYVAEYGEYPRVTGGGYMSICLTAQSGCIGSTGNPISASSSLSIELAKVGSFPQSVPNSGENRYGIIYEYNSANHVEGESQPLTITYWLEGQNKNCGLAAQTSGVDSTLSATGYTTGNDGGKTRCRVSVPGPIHS